MANTLRHRGPDDEGVWVDADSGIALAFRRLSIVDLSPLGHQPMESVTGRYVIIFNGEVYNHRELRSSLLTVSWRGGSDTETLLACIERWGVKGALERVVGMFAFAVWDRQHKCLTLARDRLGEKPLYFGTLESGDVVFGSELKALKAHPKWTGRIDTVALSAFMRANAVPSPLSIYKGIQKLPPGHMLEIRQDLSLHRSEYWSMDGALRKAEEGQATSEGETVDQLDRLLTDAVQHQMIADVPIGAFLSGGVDSSTIVALMCKGGASNVRTFSIGFDEIDYDEAPHAKRVAQHLGTVHSEEYITAKQALDVIPKLPVVYDEPFADASQLATYLLCASARRHVTVALTGDGADELFAGYDRYKIAASVWPVMAATPLSLRHWLARAIQTTPVGVLDRLVRTANVFRPPMSFTGERFHKFADKVLVASSPEGLYDSLNSSWQDPQALVVGGDTFSHTRPFGPSLVDGMCRTDLERYLPDDILVKVDRAAMAVSLETRAPFLDHRVVEFARRLPVDQRMRHGRGKWILRQVLDRYVPRHLVDRPKHGFGVPIGTWLRGPLRAWAEDLLDEDKIRGEGLLRVEPIRRKWREHLSGKYNWQYPLWTVLMFQAWYRHEFDR